jgi:hypothetical protein
VSWQHLVRTKRTHARKTQTKCAGHALLSRGHDVSSHMLCYPVCRRDLTKANETEPQTVAKERETQKGANERERASDSGKRERDRQTGVNEGASDRGKACSLHLHEHRDAHMSIHGGKHTHTRTHTHTHTHTHGPWSRGVRGC